MIKRIKRALANFLRDELLEIIGYQHNYPTTPFERYKVENIEFETVVMERLIDLRSSVFRDGSGYTIDHAIRELKHNFSQHILEHIEVDAQSLVMPDYMQAKSIKLTLRVQRKT